MTLCITFLLSGPAIAAEPEWNEYANILQGYVINKEVKGTRLNWVNYSQLKQDPVFERVIKQLEVFSPDTLENDREKQAFYINAYNILAIKMVLDHWPLKSIKDAGNFISPVWKKEAGIIGGRTMTLDEIEHKILRPMGEPRIHMAIVCASVSCPDLRREPYIGTKLDQQLDDQVDNFLRNTEKGLIVKKTEAHASRIFDWFGDDFKKDYGSTDKFIKSHIEIPDGTRLKADLPYDWSLNGE